MNYKIWPFLASLLLLPACKDDTQQPELDISGNWNVDHGFYDSCQVNATFTDELLVLTFFSLEEDACQPELYGIQNNALAIRIDDKQDYLEDDGTLVTTLQVSVPEYQAVGTLTLWESASGLTGDIVAASDPNNFLEPLLDPLYHLTPLSDHWLPLALGRWGASCEQLGFLEQTADNCELIEFTDTTSGRIKAYGGTGTSGPDGEVHERDSFWVDTTFALRHLVVGSGNTYELNIVMFGDFAEEEGVPAILTLSDDEMVLAIEEGRGILTPLQLSRMD